MGTHWLPQWFVLWVVTGCAEARQGSAYDFTASLYLQVRPVMLPTALLTHDL